MTLAFELLGVLSAAALVRAIGVRGGSLLPALTCVAVVVATVAFWRGLWPEGHALVQLHSRDSRLTPAQARALPGSKYAANEPFLAWAAGQLTPDARVFLDCPRPKPCAGGLANWITYRLGPRVFTDYPSQAQWELFYDAPGAAISYAPGFGIRRLGR